MRRSALWNTRLESELRQHPEHLRALAETLQNEAIQLAQAAEYIEAARAARDQQRERESKINYWASESECRTDEFCIAGLSQELSVSHREAEMLLIRQWSIRGHAAKARRNREIMRLARLGWTNVEISAAVHLHPKSISRIVQATLRGNR